MGFEKDCGYVVLSTFVRVCNSHLSYGVFLVVVVGGEDGAM